MWLMLESGLDLAVAWDKWTQDMTTSLGKMRVFNHWILGFFQKQQ